jgi:hypothetical protein
LLARIRAHLTSLLTWLNTLGSIVIAYALAYPNAAGELVALLPASLRPYAPALAIGWFMLVQYAKARALAARNAS